VIDVGPVNHADGGSDTVTIELSGIITIDTDLLNEIGDVSKWRGRVVRLWFQIYDENNAAQGAIVPYYTGYMSAVEIEPSPERQVIRLKVENYLATLNHASNRSYMNQADYDSLDSSAAATLAAANGPQHNKANVSSGKWQTSGRPSMAHPNYGPSWS